jgi:small-conductance mechanosensitive channel
VKFAALRIIAFTSCAIAFTAAYAQTEIGVKSTAAQDALVELAKSQAADEAALNVKVQQANSTLDQSKKALTDQLQAVSKDLNEKLQQDKKYKPSLDQITDLQKKLQDLQQTASANFQKDAGQLQQKLQTERAQVEGLIPVVKKEDDMPLEASFDYKTQKWFIPSKPAEPAKAPDAPKK